MRAWVQHPHTFLCLCSSHTRAPCLHVMPCSSSLCALCDRHALQRELQHPTSLPQETATVNSGPCGIAAAAAEDCGSVAPAYLRVSNLPPPDSFDFVSHSISRYFVCVDQVIAKTTWIIFLAVGRCTGTTPARQWGRTHRNTANLRPPSRVPSRGTRERGRRIETGAAEQGSVERKNAGRLTKRGKL